MKHQYQRLLRNPRTLIGFYFLFFISLPGGIAPIHAGLPVDLSKGIGVLAEYESNARQHARTLVRLAANDAITSDDYHKGQSLYAEAKAGFDGWIDQLVFEIKFGSKGAPSPTHQAIEERARAKGNAFVEFVRKQNPGSGNRTRGPIADKIKSVFAMIVTGTTNVSSSEQTTVIQKLQAYKWPEFHAFETSLQ